MFEKCSLLARDRRWAASATAALLGLVSGLVGAGCVEVPCGPRLSCDPPAGAADEDDFPTFPLPFCPTAPQAGVTPPDGCGVFVSSSLGDDASVGTREAPVKTIARALDLAAQSSGIIFACSEAFPEAVRVRGKVDIWGGFDCTMGWLHYGGARGTVLDAGPDVVPLLFEPRATSTIFDVEVQAKAATVPSGSSIAAAVLAGAVVHIHRGKLFGGLAAAGADGAPGHPMNAPAMAGTDGRFGQDACTDDFVSGANPVQIGCEGQNSTSGFGGEGTTDHGLSGGDGELMPIPNPGGFGLGGRGATPTVDCINGDTGANGLDGAHGMVTRGLGRFDDRGTYLGVNGGDGGHGFPGQGGGGGGGTRGGAMFCGTERKTGGASGGSGGSGGCGGRGGQGGSHGGASIGLVILNASVNIDGTELRGRQGGDGGDGGYFQIGGAPGAGALGGRGFGGSPFGCSGGDGGKGGNGGHGGGGQGGPSIGVAYVGAPPLVVRSEPSAESGGRGGLGANPSVPDSAAEAGLAAGMISFPQ
jgi:hypothetical protein